MVQQTALMLIAGLVFLFFFTPGYEDIHTPDPVTAIIFLIFLTFMPGLLSYVLGRWSIRRLTNEKDRQIKQLQNSRLYALIFGVIVIIGFIFEVYYLRLPIFVERAFSFLKFGNIRTLIGIIPMVIAILLTRLSIFEMDRYVRNTSWKRRDFLLLNLKLMILPILPFTIYLFIVDLIDHSPLPFRIFFIKHYYLNWVMMFAIIGIIYINSSFFVRRIWATHSLPDGEMRRRIDSLAERENIRYRDVLIWNTAGGKIANAGMTGLLPNSRYIFLTDMLLSNFSADEIETIVAHEFGHIKFRHIPAYLVFSLGYLAFYVVLYLRLLPLIEGSGISITAIAFLSALLSLAAFYLYFVFIFRFLSRKFERQADLYAVESAGMPEVFKSSLIRLSAISYIPRRLPRLIELVRTHPSIFSRLEFVDKVVRGDAEAIKYRKPIFHVGRASILLVLALSIVFIANRNNIFPPSEMRYEIGRQYVIDGMVDKAVTEFKEAVRIDPNSEMAHYALGILYAEKGMMEEAMAKLSEVLKINPKNKAARKILSELDVKERQRLNLDPGNLSH